MKKLFKNSFVIKLIESFLGKGSFVLFTLLFSFVCTRLYGVEVFGKYTFAFTLVSILMIFAKMGLDQGLMFSIPKDRYKYVSLSFLVNFIVSMIIVIVFWFIVDDNSVKYMLPVVWLFSCEQLFFGIYRTDLKIKEYYFINAFLSMIVRIISVICFYYIFGQNIYSIIMGLYVSFIFSNIFYLYRYRKLFNKVFFDKSYVIYSFTLVLASLTAVMMNKIDIIMLGLMTSAENVGVYQITVQITQSISVLLVVFNTVFAPQIAKMFHEQRIEEMKGLYVKATRFLALISLIVTNILLFGGEFFLNIFGSVFTEGQTALVFRAIGQFVNITVGGVWLMLSMTGQPKFQMISNVIALLINIFLNYTLIPKYGINGAAFASMITLVLTNIFGYIIVSRRFNIKVFKFF